MAKKLNGKQKSNRRAVFNHFNRVTAFKKQYAFMEEMFKFMDENPNLARDLVSAMASNSNPAVEVSND